MKLLVLVLSFALALADDGDIQAFAESSREFTATVYDEILVDNGNNILVSPFSLETLLALTQSGAVGATGAEIRSTLFLPDTKEATDAEIKGVLPFIVDDQYILKTANKIYVEKQFPIKDDFKKVATDVYQASFQNLEFADSVDAAAEINKWVEEETEGKISDVVTPDDFDDFTRVVLVNALLFQGNWSIPFDMSLTKKASFFTIGDEEVEVETMMLESAELGVFEDPDLDARFVELPFKGQDAALVIVLPNKKEGIAVLEKQTERVLAPPSYMKQFVQVILPKFRVESTINFGPVLEKLGIHAAFNYLAADFSGIAGYPGEIFISKITQKTYIDVNEVGVEAAAATAIVEPTYVPPTPVQVFNVDHPFVFYIKVKDIILFEGRVLKPEA